MKDIEKLNDMELEKVTGGGRPVSVNSQFLEFNNLKCTSCGECIDMCPVAAIRIENQTVVFDFGVCVTCEACIDACPQQALQMRWH